MGRLLSSCDGCREGILVTTSIASEDPWAAAAAKTNEAREPAIGAAAKRRPMSERPRPILGMLDDAAVLLLVALLFPVLILLIGLPVAALARLVMAIAQRF
jgi:hypothetical protein